MREVVGPTAPTALVTVMLPDSTQVSVGAGSRIRYRTRFTTRDVELIGDAEFRVKHDAARPFRVRTASAVVTDLGTLFFVRSIPKGASVVVMEGKVSLRSSSAAADSVVIEKGMSGRVADNRLSLDMPHAIEDYNDWMQGYVTFRAASLGEVAEQLSHRYVTAIRVDTSLANRQVTASFRRESLDQVLTAITTALGIRYERRGDTIVVSPK
jgi:transmembrane sensor